MCSAAFHDVNPGTLRSILSGAYYRLDKHNYDKRYGNYWFKFLHHFIKVKKFSPEFFLDTKCLLASVDVGCFRILKQVFVERKVYNINCG